MIDSISMKDFFELSQQEDLKIIDVREVDEYKAGHIPNAQNLPLSNLQDRMNELDPASKYYLICQSGGRSGNACVFLGGHGYHVINILGGTVAWPSKLVH